MVVATTTTTTATVVRAGPTAAPATRDTVRQASAATTATTTATAAEQLAGAEHTKCPFLSFERDGRFFYSKVQFAYMEQKNLPDLESLQQEAERFVRTLSPKENIATLITLSGELGAGKTSFTQGVARALGIQESVTSPTFVLEKVYELPEGKKFKKLIHIDAYRLEGEGALKPLGFDELLNEPSNLMVLEWPERVAQELPEALQLVFSIEPDNTRTISYA